MWEPMILDVECIVCNKSLQKINHNPREVTRKMGKIVHSRRSRTPNWSLEEKQCLLELIKERKEVVVMKTTNGPNHYEEKDVAWNEILGELAKKFGNKFAGSCIKKVKTQWQNMKRVTREEIMIHGGETNKYSKQALEVCDILNLIKDGVLIKDNENANLNDTTLSAKVSIKAEPMDEEMNQPSCSGTYSSSSSDQNLSMVRENLRQQSQNEPASSPVSEEISETHEEALEVPVEISTEKKKSVSAGTDSSFLEDISNLKVFNKNIQDYILRSATAEKQLKLESLKEEGNVMKAMRETAELNKIIAEQRLKHVLWIRKQEIKMYAGEPGSGAGRGGGGGGAIREAGGAFGKMEAAREDEYFYKKQKEQLQNLKSHLDKEISFHQEQIKRHEDAIRRHKQQQSEMEKK